LRGDAVPVSFLHCIMAFKVVSIGDVTSNGNRIVKMQNKIEVSTVMGTMRRSETYYAAVKADDVAVEVDAEIELDLTMFHVIERPFAHPETGEEIMLKWLSLKA